MSGPNPSMTIQSLFPAEVVTQELTVPAPVEDLHPAERACIDRAVLRRRLDFHDVSIRVFPADGEFEPTAPACTACAGVMFSRGRYVPGDGYVIAGLAAQILEAPHEL